MKKITAKKFNGQEVILDGHHYDECTFDSCTFVYSGGAPFSMTNNNITGDTEFSFIGAAANTVAAMKGIYSMGDFGRSTILNTFQQIAPDVKNLH